MNYWYKDRDFPEVKESNASIIAVIQNDYQLLRVIMDHNSLVDKILHLEEAVRTAQVKMHTVYRDLDKEVNAAQRKQLLELNGFLRKALNEKEI